MDVLTGSPMPELSADETTLLGALHTRYMARIPRTPSTAAVAAATEAEAKAFKSELEATLGLAL